MLEIHLSKVFEPSPFLLPFQLVAPEFVSNSSTWLTPERVMNKDLVVLRTTFKIVPDRHLWWQHDWWQHGVHTHAG